MEDDIEIKRWLNRAKRLINSIPEGTEVHIGYTHLSVYPKGRMNKHMGSAEDGFGISDESELGFIETNGNFIPYSEGA